MSTDADRSSLAGRVCLVTGATNGHGRALAHLLAERGAELVLLGRNPALCTETQAEIAERTGVKPDVLLCDLSRQGDIDRAASEFLASGRPLHVLVNNAGLVSMKRTVNDAGHEMTFAVNYLGAFQLSVRLLPRMIESAPARLVIVSSDTYRIARLDLDDLMLEKRYGWMRAYANSKLALVHMTRALARRLDGTGVTVNAVDPGPIASNIGANNPGILYSLASRMIRYTFPSARRAARTALHLCTAPELTGSGDYWRSMKRRDLGDDPKDAETAERLFAKSVELTGADLA